jgi:hypothetical protein
MPLPYPTLTNFRFSPLHAFVLGVTWPDDSSGMNG